MAFLKGQVDKIDTKVTELFDDIKSSYYKNPLDPLAITWTNGVRYVGSVYTGTDKYAGGCLGDNGKVYFIPSSATQALEYDPFTRTSSVFGTALPTYSQKYKGGTMATNGKIYCCFYNGSTHLEIDPTTKTMTTFGNISIGGSYWGCVLGKNGKVYGVPYNENRVCEIDPATRTATYFGNITGNSKFMGGVLAPNGKIYCAPALSGNILEIDTDTKTCTTIPATGTSGGQYCGFLLGMDGLLYGIPTGSTNKILVFNPTTKAIELRNSNITTSFNKFGSGIVDTSGAIHLIPDNGSEIWTLDPRSTTDWHISISRLRASGSTATMFYGAVLAENGKMYLAPSEAGLIAEVQVNTGENGWYLSPYLNKL